MNSEQEKNSENAIYQEKNLGSAIDKFQIAKLEDRYDLSLQSVYNRLETLNIKQFKEGRTSYITDVQLQLMDSLHEHLKNGGKTAEFVAARIESGEIVPKDVPSGAGAVVLAEEQASTPSDASAIVLVEECSVGNDGQCWRRSPSIS